MGTNVLIQVVNVIKKLDEIYISPKLKIPKQFALMPEPVQNCPCLDFLDFLKKVLQRVVVVAQLVEWSLPIPEVGGSNPVIAKNLY